MVKICKNCIKANDDNDVFCRECGKPLEEKPDFSKDFHPYEKHFQDVTASLEDELKKIQRELDSSLEDMKKGMGIDTAFDKNIHSEKIAFLDKPQQTEKERREKVDLYKVSDIEKMDGVFKKDFHLDRYGWFYSSKLFVPITYCGTLEEYIEYILFDLDISDKMKKSLIEHSVKESEEQMENGEGNFGVFIPNRGCYINGWLCCKVIDKTIDPEKGLGNPRVKPLVAGVAAHEKLGHGFLSFFTKYGLELQKVNFYKQRIATSFNLKQVDTPEYTLWNEKNGILYHISKYTEEGWATYIENRIIEKFELPAAKKQYTAEKVISALSTVAKSDKLSEEEKGFFNAATAAVFTALVDSEKSTDSDVIQAVAFLQNNEYYLDSVFKKTFGQPPRYVIGNLLMKKAEAKYGAEVLPLLLGVAGNLTYNVENISASDLKTAVSGNPALNIDIRTALLTTLDVPNGDIEGFAKKANEELNYAVPRDINFKR